MLAVDHVGARLDLRPKGCYALGTNFCRGVGDLLGAVDGAFVPRRGLDLRRRETLERLGRGLAGGRGERQAHLEDERLRIARADSDFKVVSTTLSQMLLGPVAAELAAIPFFDAASGRPSSFVVSGFNPQFGNLTVFNPAGSASTYHGFSAKVERRFASGLGFLASYTFSKYLESTESANVYEKLTDKVVASRDTPHILVMSYVYDFPFGRGKALGGSMHPVLNAMLGNWTISGVQRYQSGNPIGVGSSQNLFGAGNARPNYVLGEPLLNPSWNPDDPTSSYINPKAFIQPANMVYGTAAARISQLRTPLQLNEDVAMGKTFFLGRERTNLEFRASAFNVANRHLLGGLSTNVTSNTYGRFSNPQANQPRNVQFSLRLSF